MAREKMWPDGKQALAQVAQSNGKQRRLPPINPSIQQMVRENTVHVFNVGPWGYRENMGSFGYFFIPKCEVGAVMEWHRVALPTVAPGVWVPDMWEEGDRRVKDPRTEYAAMRPLPGLMIEPMPKDQDSCEWNMSDEGRYFANELLGVGIGHAQQDSRVRRGCFIAAGKTPTDKELTAARGELERYMAALILEADQAWAAGPQRAEQVIRPEVHHVCAEWMNLTDRDWLRGTKPQGRDKCDNCGRMVDKGVATCQCGQIMDAEAYKRNLAKQERIKAEMAAA